MTRREWNERYGADELVWTARPNRFLVDQLAGAVPGSALDVGCGEGRNAVWLATEGWTVTGVDFSPVAIDKARRLASSAGVNVDWLVADVTEWEPPAAYDLVLVFYLHLAPEALRSALRSAADAVSTGGTLLIVGHARRNLTEGYGGPQVPDVLYDADDLVSAIGTLDVIRAGEVERPVEVEGRTAIDVLVRAQR